MIISNNMLKDIIRKEYLKDKQAQRALVKLIRDFKKTSIRLLLFQGLIYVSEHQQNDMIRMYHDDLLREH